MEMQLSTEHVNMGLSDALVDIWIKFEANKEIGLTDLPTPGKAINFQKLHFNVIKSAI